MAESYRVVTGGEMPEAERQRLIDGHGSFLHQSGAKDTLHKLIIHGLDDKDVFSPELFSEWAQTEAAVRNLPNLLALAAFAVYTSDETVPVDSFRGGQAALDGLMEHLNEVYTEQLS